MRSKVAIAIKKNNQFAKTIHHCRETERHDRDE